jgi:hypothetical protein
MNINFLQRTMLNIHTCQGRGGVGDEWHWIRYFEPARLTENSMVSPNRIQLQSSKIARQEIVNSRLEKNDCSRFALDMAMDVSRQIRTAINKQVNK